MTKAIGILIGLAAALGILYVLRNPRWAVMLVLLMFPLEQILQAYLPILVEHHMVFNFVLGSVVALAVVIRFFRGDNLAIGVVNRVSVCALILYAMAWVSLIWSPSQLNASRFLTDNLAYFVLLIAFTPLLLDDLADFGRIAIGFMLVGSIIAVLILIHPDATYYAGRLTFDIGLWEGQRGGRSNPLALADMGGFMAVIAVLVKLEGRRPGLTLLRVAAFILGVGIAIATGSRGQVLAVGLTGVFFFPLARRMADPKQFIVAAVGLGAAAALFYVTFMLFIGEENRERWDLFGAATDTGGRLDMVMTLLMAYLSSPLNWIQGLGANAFTSLGAFGRVPYVHNIFIEVLCELGLIGGFLFATIASTTFRNGRWLWRTFANDPSRRALAALVGALCFFDTLVMLKQGSFVAGGAYALTSWLVMAKITTLELRRQETAALAPAPADDDLEAAGEWEDEDHEALAEAYERGEWSGARADEGGEYAPA